MRAKQSIPKTIDDYSANFPLDVQALLGQIRQRIREAAPAAEEAIKHQIPTFILKGNLVHFGAFKNHIGFYPGASGIAKFETELSAYKSAKGSVQFPFDKPLPLSLIGKIVKFRVKENLDHTAAKAKKK